eukprot:scaffold56720_cov56-Attheya_sp.AAC.6
MSGNEATLERPTKKLCLETLPSDFWVWSGKEVAVWLEEHVGLDSMQLLSTDGMNGQQLVTMTATQFVELGVNP